MPRSMPQELTRWRRRQWLKYAAMAEIRSVFTTVLRFFAAGYTRRFAAGYTRRPRHRPALASHEDGFGCRQGGQCGSLDFCRSEGVAGEDEGGSRNRLDR